MSDFIITHGELYYVSDSDSSDDYLEHHGVKGMRWGVRRQQKLLAKAQAKTEKEKLKSELKQLKEATKKAKEEAKLTKSGKIDKQKPEDLSAAKLKELTDRNNNIKNYYESQNNLKIAQQKYMELHPEKHTLAQRFMNKAWPKIKDKALNVAIDVGEAYAKDKLRDALGLNEATDLGFEKTRLENEEKRRKFAKEDAEAADKKSKADKEAADKKAADKQAKKEAKAAKKQAKVEKKAAEKQRKEDQEKARQAERERVEEAIRKAQQENKRESSEHAQQVVDNFIRNYNSTKGLFLPPPKDRD